MKLEQGLYQRPEQRMLLLPKMLQSIEILQLGNMELEALVHKSLTENETLRLQEERQSQEDRKPEREKTMGDRTEWPGSRKPSRDASDRHQEWLANTPARPKTLREHLEDQASLLEISSDQMDLVFFIIGNIDENGYLNVSDEDLLRNYPGEITPDQLEEALHLIHGMEPRGVGGRGPLECLLLQLDEGDPHHQVLKRLLMEFLEDLSKNRLPKVARALGIEIDDLKSILGRIRNMNPRPGSEFAGEAVPNIRPDVVVELREGRYEVRVEDGFLPRLEVDTHYRSLAKNKKTTGEVKGYLKEKIDQARWLIEAIEQRRMTLLRVARAVFSRQQEFLSKGPRAIKPLMMKEIAEELGIHVSTVSRSVAEKYAQTPVGIFPLRLFFTGSTEGDQDTSRISVRERIRDLVAGEDPKAPLSDEDIVARLKDRGIQVARRTVAKYRTELNIPSSWRRRKY